MNSSMKNLGILILVGFSILLIAVFFSEKESPKAPKKEVKKEVKKESKVIKLTPKNVKKVIVKQKLEVYAEGKLVRFPKKARQNQEYKETPLKISQIKEQKHNVAPKPKARTEAEIRAYREAVSKKHKERNKFIGEHPDSYPESGEANDIDLEAQPEIDVLIQTDGKQLIIERTFNGRIFACDGQTSWDAYNLYHPLPTGFDVRISCMTSVGEILIDTEVGEF